MSVTDKNADWVSAVSGFTEQIERVIHSRIATPLTNRRAGGHSAVNTVWSS
jgi:hypothetical protein